MDKIMEAFEFETKLKKDQRADRIFNWIKSSIISGFINPGSHINSKRINDFNEKIESYLSSETNYYTRIIKLKIDIEKKDDSL